MAYTTIDDPSAYFHIKLYNGNGSTQSITNDANAGDFKPDWLWTKSRNDAFDHITRDSSRGVSQRLITHSTAAEDSASGTTSFDTNGFSLDSTNTVNKSTDNYVAWQWKANGGTTSSNTSGDITTTVQANTTAGFSIFTYTGTGTAGDTIGHGLGVVPNWIIIKSRSIANDWTIYHSANTSAPETDFLILQGTDATSDSNTRWNDTAPTSTLITLGNNAGVNGSTQTYVGYAFAEKQGYSKFGSYTGNGNADGSFVYTGFQPAFFLVKNTSVSSAWRIYSNKISNQSGFNDLDVCLFANTSEAETGTGHPVDFVSNGIKMRGTNEDINQSGNTFIYMAFAEHPFVGSDGVSTTAR